MIAGHFLFQIILFFHQPRRLLAAQHAQYAVGQGLHLVLARDHGDGRDPVDAGADHFGEHLRMSDPAREDDLIDLTPAQGRQLGQSLGDAEGHGVVDQPGLLVALRDAPLHLPGVAGAQPGHERPRARRYAGSP